MIAFGLRNLPSENRDEDLANADHLPKFRGKFFSPTAIVESSSSWSTTSLTFASENCSELHNSVYR
jgi:hypothetical protein